MHKSILILKQIYIAYTNIHSQYEFKPPYNTMQATRLLQYNNSPQNQSQTSQLQCLQVLKSIKVLFITSNQQGPLTFARN